jgi:uncharacterized protein (DUF1697 family)
VSGERWFAFLRAINTGNRRLTNEQLLAPFHELGFTDVAAYQAAGNVTFRTDRVVDEQAIETALVAAYGFEAPTFVRSFAQLSAIVAAEPFTPHEVANSAGKAQVTFLRASPTQGQVDDLMSLVPDEDRVRVLDQEWYWLPVEGVSDSKLPVGRIERLLGEMTMRTLGTVQRMVIKFDG